MRYKVLFLGVDCDVSRMIYHAIKDNWEVEKVILEQPVGLGKKIKFRLKKLGFINVLGQLLFKIAQDFFIIPFSKKRKQEIIQHYNSSIEEFPFELLLQLNDIHDGDWDIWMLRYKPDFIIVNGTRIIKKELLDKLNVPVVNIHAGITPMYRGVHGGYWALVNSDKANFGATIHLVDKGVDTGRILKRVHTLPSARDNFYTYPYLQFAAAIQDLVYVVEMHMLNCDRALPKVDASFSKQWYYPTIFTYIYFRVTQGVK
jgi:hypothetical protein